MKSKLKGQKREAKIEKFTRVLLIWDLCDCLQKVEEKRGWGKKCSAKKVSPREIDEDECENLKKKKTK